VNQLKKERKIKSKDGVEYTLTVFEDIVTLNQGQIEYIERRIEKLESSHIESSKGIPINDVTFEQSIKVTELISQILGEFESIEEIIESEIIDTTLHAQTDRISNTEICIERDWDPDNVDYEIAECLKRSYKVEQIRLRFHPQTKKSWTRFGFTIRGYKGGRGVYNDAKLVIHFDEDPVEKDKSIVIITILTPDA
jgi:hypothetical protein